MKEQINQLPNPKKLKKQIPIDSATSNQIQSQRNSIKDIIS